ncbi:hypothetical protein [Bordetella petrii]|uniref:hypothetical protein n=1 Tax=Bordetella petrii TaxID=94624 RepID=UPI000490E64D|nr:hypothetical protein [Bordetella petrii]
MTYDLEAINTLYAQIGECMHRNAARAMRLLGQAKAKVQAALERAANCQGVRLAALEEAAAMCDRIDAGYVDAPQGGCWADSALGCAGAIRAMKVGSSVV